MSSIPLPALAIRPSENPLDQAAKLLSVKSMLGQQQEQQQQIQSGDIELQMKQIGLKNTQIVNSALSDPKVHDEFSEWEKGKTGGGAGAAPTTAGTSAGAGVQLDPFAQFLVEKKGLPLIGPGGGLEVSKPLVAAREQAATLLKTQGETAKNALEVHSKQIDNLAQESSPIFEESDPAKQQTALGTFKNKVLTAPDEYPPEFVKGVQGIQSTADLARYVNQGKVIQHITEDATKRAAAEKQATQATAEKMKLPGGPMNPVTQAVEEARQKAPIEVATRVAAETDPRVLAARTNQAVATEVAKQRALAPQLQQITSSTRAGRQYINREDIPKASEGVVEQQANNAGIPVVDKDVAGTLQEIDTAKANQQSMMNLVGGKLAQSPGERIYKGPANKLESAMQTDPTLAAMGTFRNAAIQSMRAVAGSKGLRINQYEVQLAIDNDIPKMTDTWQVANAKMSALQQFLDNTENAHLTRNRATGGAAPKVTPGSSTDPFAQFGGRAHPQ